MKKISLTLIALFAALSLSYAQTNTFPSSGNAGIGTTSPTQLLHATGSGAAKAIKVETTSDHATFAELSTNSGAMVTRLQSNSSLGFVGTLTNHRFDIFSNGIERISVANTGNVGIGTTSPAYKLDVNGTGNYSGNLTISGGSVAATNYGGLTYPYNTAFGSGADASYTKLYAGSTSGAMNGVFVNGGGAATPNVITLSTASSERMRINADGNVSIGTDNPKGYKFAVNGDAIATSMKVKLNANWPDFVFLREYKLPTLTEVKTYIDKNQHLPDMPSADEVHKNGLDLGEMNRLLLKKVEELTLYLINQDQKNKALEEKLSVVIEQLADLKKGN